MTKRLFVFLAVLVLLVGAVFVQLRRSRTVRSSHFSTATVKMNDVLLHVRIPVTASASAQGLSGVTELLDTEGMLWEYSPSAIPTFWMKGMMIDLDFLWITNGRVVAITDNVPAPTATLNLPLYQPPVAVTERHAVTVGTAVEIRR